MLIDTNAIIPTSLRGVRSSETTFYAPSVCLRTCLSIVSAGVSVTVLEQEGVWMIWDQLRISSQSAGSLPTLIK